MREVKLNTPGPLCSLKLLQGEINGYVEVYAYTSVFVAVKKKFCVFLCRAFVRLFTHPLVKVEKTVVETIEETLSIVALK